ncbi:PAS domain-containing protein [Aureimonas sp. AU4]|uniref:PAS domain-containing protein n=1 Tax=Aureimonas sp. AU4 TaxID=1638163 RepID=UPI0007815349|nr:PAS domain-containing protein [Aureimonas sp. AU4]
MPDRFEQDRIQGEIGRSSASKDPFAAAVRATRMPMVITDPLKHDNPIVFVNASFERLTGYTRDECVGRNCRFLQGPGTNPDDVAKLREAIANRTTVETEILNYRKDGSTFWNHVLISPVFDDDGMAAFFFASQFDVTPERNRLAEVQQDRANLEYEIERRINDLARTEDRLRFTLGAGRLGAWTLDLKDRRLVSSARCKENFGRGPTDTFTYDDLVSSIHPGDLLRWQEALNAAITDDGGEFGIEYRAVAPDGQVRWVEVRGQVNRDVDGVPIGMAGVSIDITARKRSDEHRELLAGELDHRVKNTLANVQSIISQTLQSAPSLEEAAKILSSRIQALASAHEVLLSDAVTSADLHQLIANALRPFLTAGDGRISVTGPSIRLRSRVATTVTLAIHELATNAAKYGALSTKDGSVSIMWKIDGPANDRFELCWEESDGPAVVAPARRGFGSRVLERALPLELNGTATTDYRPTGLRYCLQAGLSGIVEGAAV